MRDVSFNVAAEAYDGFMGAWSEPLSAHLIEFADVRPGQRVLDVGCGPGALTAELVRRLGADAVFAVDPSAPFVAAAAARNPGVDIRLASAEALPYPDGSFDVALAQLVVHFMADPVAGLREMARVALPGGVVAASVWDFAGERGPLGPFWEAARELDADVVDESRLAGARRGHLAALFETVGLGKLEAGELKVERAYENFDAWWEPFIWQVGPAGALVASLDPDRRAALRERCRSMLPDGAFVLTAVAWAERGVVQPRA